MKWLLKSKNKEDREFLSFDNAVTAMKKEIVSLLERNSGDGDEIIPFGLGPFFEKKWLCGTITDEELILKTRLSMLLNSLRFQNMEEGTKQASESIYKNYSYCTRRSNHGCKFLSLEIKRNGIEISLVIDEEGLNHGHNELKTNAFVFKENEETDYYFIFKATINCFGKKHIENIDEKITLTKNES